MSDEELVWQADVEWARADARQAGRPDEVIERLRAAVDDPARRGDDFSAAWTMVVISELQQEFGRPEDAVGTLRTAVANGIGDQYTDPQAWLAALLVDQGRPEEAREVFGQLRVAGRADPSAYELFGEAWEAAGDLDTALRVFEDGQEAAERAGEGELARSLVIAAGRVRRAKGFASAASAPDLPVDRPAARPAGRALRGARFAPIGAGPDGHSYEVMGSLLFWPRAEYEQLIGRWPELAEQVGADWDAHRARCEQGFVRMSEDGVPAAFTVGEFAEFAAFLQHGTRQPSEETLASYARESVRADDFTVWPPERNVACWCGSGRKYKRCCRVRGVSS